MHHPSRITPSRDREGVVARLGVRAAGPCLQIHLRQTDRIGLFRPLPPPQTPHAAFTLIEVVLVLVIMSLLMAVAQPRIASYVNNDRVRRSADRLAMDLRLAQSEAIKQQAVVTISFDTTQDTYTLTNLSPDSQGATERTVALGSDSYYRTSVAGVVFPVKGLKSVSFDSFGSPDSGGTITLASGRITCTITVDSVTGRPTVSALSYKTVSELEAL
ncbi:MAG: GspH/FimT family pseudopilin [Planctomycetes bacterium]|nr:GspH/FimT family pseudopilin [Planctomycetota bacterium]